jgi:predicted dehydrogenase
MEPVRFGLVGYGFGGRFFHAPLIASAPGCELVAVQTTAPERRAQVAAEWPGAATVDGLDELVAAGVEAVAISTPADTHTALTEQALRRGLAVVCDKPFALDAAAARGTAELAERLGPALSPYQNRRWDSEFRTVQRVVGEGRLGRVTRFESRFERFAPQDGPPAAGGGTLLDFGSHLVDQALVLLGPVESVYAEFRRRDSGLDDDVFVALAHRGGARAHLWGSWSQAAPGPRYRVTGTEGSCVLVDDDGQERALVAGRTPATDGDGWGVEPAGFHARLHRGGGEEPLPVERGRWDAFYPAFARAVRGAGPVPVAARDAVATAVVLDAARTSATTGAVVPIAP